MPLISAIVPTYNRPKFLESTLLALYEQTFKDFEVIVVDDGSNDYEANFNKMICDVYSKMELDIKYIKLHKNSGTVSIPRNIGVANATGQYIAPVDDDCFCEREKFEILSELMGDNVVLAYGERIDCEKRNGTINQLNISNTSYLAGQKFRLGVDNGQFIYKNDTYTKVGPAFPINACDWETYKLLAPYGDFAYTPDVVCKYIWHENNSSRTPKEKRVDPMKVLGEFKQYFVGTKFEGKINV
jgi:glycosyltransferase involved in cell wall biosynthesis